MELRIEEQGLIVCILQGMHRKDDAIALREEAAKVSEKTGKVKVLVILDGFEGWEDAMWDDPRLTSMDMRLEARIERVAFVGDRKWKDLALAATGYPFTAKAVKYFDAPREAEARAWLGERGAG